MDKNLINVLKKIKNDYSFEKINKIIESISKLKVLIIGDTILDEYDYVSPLGKPSKENIIATLYENKELFAGGIFSSINTISSFCDNVDFITTIGSQKIESNFIRQNIPKNIKDELGDLLFSLVNLSRFLNINPEAALRMTISKFETRFAQVEKELKKRGKSLSDSSLEEMDEIWNLVKKRACA